jgi:2-C-methyl-D-erythritol 4-phosphate cytidylyltransferase
MTVAAIVVAAGSGARLGADVPKAFVAVGGRTLLEHAVRPFTGLSLVVVAPAAMVSAAAELVPTAVVVPGGSTRQESVRCGLAVLPPEIDIVLVHDAARSFTPPDVVDRVIAAVRDGAEAAIPVLPVSDTVKRIDRDGNVVETLDRTSLVAVQTPQGFRRDVLEAAHAAAHAEATDDAGLVERRGGRVVTVPGATSAFKITVADDLARAAALMTGRP